MSFCDKLLENRDEFNYRMLSRLQSDCEYFIKRAGVSERNLWTSNVESHIKEMKKIYNQIQVKPDWISIKYINTYENKC